MKLVNSVEDAVAEQLEAQGFDVRRPQNGPDLMVTVPTSEGEHALVVDTKSFPVSARAFPGSAMQGAEPPTRMLAQRYVSPSHGLALRARGVPYVDTVGNIWLQLPGLYIFVEGRPAPTEPPRGSSGDRLSRPSSMRITFALMVQPPLLEANLRELASACGTSVGAAQAATADLAEGGFLHGRGINRRLRRTGALAERWVSDFRPRLLPKLDQRVVRGPTPRWWLEPTHRPTMEHGSLGGETACELLGYPLRAAETLVYGRPPWGQVRKLGRLGTNGEAVVTLREQFWPDRVDDRATVPHLLVYADLLTQNEPRLRDMAALMREEDDELRRLWAD